MANKFTARKSPEPVGRSLLLVMHQIDDQVRVPVRKNVVSASSEPVQPPAFMYGEEVRERFGVLEVRQVACLSQVDMQEDAAVVPGALINKKLDSRK